MRLDLRFLVAVAVLPLFVGCSLVYPWKQEVLLETDPPGAVIYVDGEEVGETPMRVAVRKAGSTPVNSNNPALVEFKKAGYRDARLKPSAQKLSPAGWADAFLTLGLTAVTPGFWAFSHERYSMTLEREDAPDGRYASADPRASRARPTAPRYRGGYSRKIAVVIGIDDYASWPPLEGGRRDAQRVADRLRALGFDEVIEVFDGDATRRRMLKLLGTELVMKSDPESLVLIYFAGHGQTETLASGDRRGYIVPVDATTGDAFSTAISMEKIQDLSRRIPAKHLYYAMDSCYSGLGLTRGIAVKTLGGDYLEEATSRRAVQMMTAGGEGEQAIEVGGRGLFTTYLLEAIGGAADANADGYVSASEIGQFVRPRVAGASNGRQTPQFGTLDGAGEVLFSVGR
ncbi:MAG: caspase family protein [bacterium]|nr:caspase family protein [bacterium]